MSWQLKVKRSKNIIPLQLFCLEVGSFSSLDRILLFSIAQSLYSDSKTNNSYIITIVKDIYQFSQSIARQKTIASHMEIWLA